MTHDLKIFITLFVSTFTAILGVGIVVPLLPVYAHELGGSAFQIGLIFGAFSLTRSMLVPYFGRMSDKKGRRPFLISGLAMNVILSVIYTFSTSVNAVIIIRLGQGIASAMVLPVAQAYVGDITPKGKEGTTMSYFNMALYGGLSFGPLLGGVAKDTWGIRFSFLCMGALIFISFLLCFFLLPRREEHGGSRISREEKDIKYLNLIKTPGIFSLLIFRLCFMIGTGLIWAFLPLIANTEYALSSTAIGALIMVNVLVGGVIQVPMGYIADRYNKILLITLGGLIGALSIGYMIKAETFLGLFLANSFFGLAGGISLPSIMALAVIQGHKYKAMGSIMGLINMAHSVGMLVGPLISGIILDNLPFRNAFMFGSATLIIGTFLFLILHRKASQR